MPKKEGEEEMKEGNRKKNKKTAVTAFIALPQNFLFCELLPNDKFLYRRNLEIGRP